MLIFITDSETTGLPNQEPKAVMIEFAGILYHVETRARVASVQCLIHSPSNAAEHINKISVAALEVVNPKDNPAMKAVSGYAKKYAQTLWDAADYVIAHNASFDKIFMDPVFNPEGKTQWRCSKNDIKFPKAKNARSLVYIAVDHGVFPFGAHRAMNDCTVLADCLDQVPDLADQLSQRPQETARWETIDLPFERNADAKAAGFRFDRDKKVWWKEMKESETQALSFRVQKPQ